MCPSSRDEHADTRCMAVSWGIGGRMVHRRDGGRRRGARGGWARRVEVSYPPRPTPTPSFRRTALHFRRHCCRCVSLHCQSSLFSSFLPPALPPSVSSFFQTLLPPPSSSPSVFIRRCRFALPLVRRCQRLSSCAPSLQPSQPDVALRGEHAGEYGGGP